MKVGLVIYGDLGQATGGYLYDRMLVRELRRRGHSVNVLSLRKKPHIEQVADNSDPAVRSWMRKQDVIVQDELCHPSLYRLNLQRERPVVALVHNLSTSLGPPSDIARSMERSFLESVDAVVCTSRATLGACQSLCPHPLRAAVAHPGRGHMMPQPHLQGSGELRVLHVGNIHPTKGLDVLLAALSELFPAPFRLEVAGAITDAPFRRSLDDLMDAPLRSRVRFLGPVPEALMCERYRRADVVAVPSRYEGFGIALLEAMGFGVPVIAGREGGSGELVTHGREGFLVRPGDQGAVVRHLRFLSDNARREGMGKAARRRWEAQPTWEESLTAAVDLIEDTPSDVRRTARERGAPL